MFFYNRIMYNEHGKEGLSLPCHVAALFDVTTWSRGRPLLIASQFPSMRQVWGLPVLVALIFDATRRVSTLLVTSFTHFRCGKEGETLVVTSKPNPPNPGHRYGFRAGDFHSTRTRTCPTHTHLPARVHKPVTGPNCVLNCSQKLGWPWWTMQLTTTPWWRRLLKNFGATIFITSPYL